MFDETSPRKEDEREITQIEKFEDEEYQIGSEEEEDIEEEDLPPKIRKI